MKKRKKGINLFNLLYIYILRLFINQRHKHFITESSMQNSSSKLGYDYSSIEDILQCPICLNRFDDPRALPCQHVFCYSCMKTITTSNKLCSMITCPLCRLIYPYNNNPDQFPRSYTHKQLLDLIPVNYMIKGKCSKCKKTHSLNFCPCCGYYLCRNCMKNDRGNILINLKNLLPNCSNLLSADLSHKTALILTNPQIVEIQDILTLYHQVYEIANRPHENSSRAECESTVCSNGQDDDDEIIYIQTIQSNSPLTLDE